jgi:hypothetical protein
MLTASATSAGSTAIPQLRVTATQEVPAATPATPATPADLYRPEPAFVQALPGPRACAPAITPETGMDLPPLYEEHMPSSLLWMLPLGMGMMLVGIGLALIFRAGR